MKFDDRTRQDFIDMQARRDLVFQPTPEEIKQSQEQELRDTVTLVQFYLAKYNIVFTGNETPDELKALWALYINGNGTPQNPDAGEDLGNQARRDERIKYFQENENTIMEFCVFVRGLEMNE